MIPKNNNQILCLENCKRTITIVSKYNSLKILKKTKARIEHICENCGRPIDAGVLYYSLELSGRVHCPGFKRRAFCEECYGKLGEGLMRIE